LKGNVGIYVVLTKQI